MATGRWPAILVIYAIGLLASAQLGKFAALVPVIQPDLGLGLTAAAGLVSLIETGGAAIGLFAGAVVGRHGTRAVLAVGLALLAIAGFGEAAAASVPALFAWRLVESLGYLAIVVAAPTLMALAAAPAQRGTAMALWSTFFPVGFALGSVLAGLMAPALSWRPVLFASAALSIVALAVVWFLPRPEGDGQRGPPRRAGLPPLPVWWLSVGFGCYTVFAVGQIALLPSYLADRLGLATGAAGLATGLASFATVAGGLAAARLMRRRAALPALLGVCMVVPAVMLFGVFGLRGTIEVVGLAVALNVITGIIPAVTFARLPDLSPTAGAMARGNGLLAQCGAAGSLLGPPAYAAAVGLAGWQGAAITGAVMSALSLILLLGAFRSAQAGPMTAGSSA
jgi:MFS family permease